MNPKIYTSHTPKTLNEDILYTMMDSILFASKGGVRFMNKNAMPLLIVTIFVIPILCSSGEVFEERAEYDVLDSKLIHELDKVGSDDRLEIIVQFKNSVEERDLSLLDAFDFEIKRTYHVIPAVHAVGSKSSILMLSQYSRTYHIEYNEELHYLMDESTTTINATRVWASQVVYPNTRAGINRPAYVDGTDVTVVVLDSGIDAGHPDLDYGEKTIMNLKSDLDGGYTEAENTDTSSGHGTHCSGTIAGNGDASGGARKGVAPGANLIGLSTGEAVVISNALGALEWVYDHSRPNANPHNIRAVSNSWGSSGAYDPNNAINQVTRRIVNDNNVAVVFAAGNAGADNHDGSTVTTNPYSLEPSVISVAAIERDGSGIASFSSRGSAEDNFTWPDIGAPGVHIWATEARKTLISAMRKQDPNDAMDGYYMSISGTSMATPHISGLTALIWQAAPSLRMSEFHDDFQTLNESEYWENPDYMIHETELIMKLTAGYIPPTADNGVPSNNSTGLNNQQYDFAQGYGLVNAEKAVALALTLEEMRRTDRDVTVMDAYYRYFNITTKGIAKAKTNVLATSWTGDWSQLTDPENPASYITTPHPRSVFVHNKTTKIIAFLEYPPVSTSERYAGELTLVIDFNGDGSIDWRGDSSFDPEGGKLEEIDVGSVGGAGQYWDFNVEGRVTWIPTPKGIGAGENEFNEALIEYSISLQMVFDIDEGETVTYETGDYHARIAQPEFGVPTQDYAGNGTLEMMTLYYDLNNIYMEEATPPEEPPEQGFPWWAVIIALIVIGLLFYYVRFRRISEESVKFSTAMTNPQSNPNPSRNPTGEIVEAEVVTAVPVSESGNS